LSSRSCPSIATTDVIITPTNEFLCR
jgi:hypothetical protein